MSHTGRFLFLGTGASMGVPLVGCDCAVCQSPDPHNKRLRPSGLVQVKDRVLLIDPGPDFREQALRANVEHVDGVIITHTHYDHIGGMDDLRIFFFRQGQPLPCLLSKGSLKDVKDRMAYLFEERTHGQNITAQFDFQVLGAAQGEEDFLGVHLNYLTYRQGTMLVNGFRFGDFAYCSDICDYRDDIFEQLRGLDTLVISALRHEPSHVHFTVAEALAFAEKVGARMTWLTHVAHDLDHKTTNAALPDNVQLAHDGLEVAFQYTD